jgi:2-keto-myo-inositol isomerase
MSKLISRRAWLSTGAGAIGAAACAPLLCANSADESPSRPNGSREPFRISLNTSTLRGHKLPFTEVIEIAAKAGYGGIEPWPDELDRHVGGGGTLKDAAKRLKDAGLAVTGAIAFFEWMVDDDAKRAKAMEEAKRRMDQFAQIGATHIAAPPAGDVEKVELLRAAERYRALLDLSEASGVVPSVEVWGFAKNGFRLGQCAMIAIEAHHPKACVLPDVYHLYKGGSGFDGIRHLAGSFLAGFHLNDYPANPPRETITDASRVYPGDGIAPLKQLFRDLKAIGYTGALSIELFNPEYYKQDPLLVAKTALEKARAVMASALG